MQKISFCERYMLTTAVLNGKKTIRFPQKSHKRKDVKDLSGMRYGCLTVIKRDHIGGDRNWYYLCKCDCGNTTIVRSNALTGGNTCSCGCQKGKKSIYSKSKTRLYKIWKGMKSRCYNPNNPAYKRYGGKGVHICSEWLDNFQEFENWALSNGYKECLSIDRVNVNGNYEPSNCRWATAQEQADNKTCNILININGETKNLQQWCNQYVIKRSTVMTRVNQCGWDYVKAITTPVRRHV